MTLGYASMFATGGAGGGGSETATGAGGGGGGGGADAGSAFTVQPLIAMASSTAALENAKGRMSPATAELMPARAGRIAVRDHRPFLVAAPSRHAARHTVASPTVELQGQSRRILGTMLHQLALLSALAASDGIDLSTPLSKGLAYGAIALGFLGVEPLADVVGVHGSEV